MAIICFQCSHVHNHLSSTQKSPVCPHWLFSYVAHAISTRPGCRLGLDLARFAVKCRSARPNITLLFLRQSGAVRPRGEMHDWFLEDQFSTGTTQTLVHLGRERKFHSGLCAPAFARVSWESYFYVFWKHPDQPWKFFIADVTSDWFS